MTPERVAGLVARWVRFYTRNLPPAIVERRTGEIDADLHDHIAHDRAHGIRDRRIAFSIAARMVRGIAADASWRRATIAGSPRRNSAYRSGVRIALVTAVVLLVPLVATLATDGEGWSLGDFVFAAVLLAGTGLLLEARRQEAAQRRLPSRGRRGRRGRHRVRQRR